MIIVTGAGGIVGQALCRTMHDRSLGFLPIAHRPEGAQVWPQGVVIDLATAVPPFADLPMKVDAIVHLAAAVPHSSAYPDNEQSAALTSQMDRNILALQAATGAHVIYMSPCGLYDRRSPDFKDEDCPIMVTTPYFEAKARGEELFTAGGKATILRLAAPLGSGIKSGLVLSRFIEAACSGESITIWGNGTREQNYVDCRDISELIVRVLAQPEPTILNVAAPLPTTMLELAKSVVHVVGRGRLQMGTKPDPRDGETARYSIARASALYGWVPQVDLINSIRRIVAADFPMYQ